MDSVSNSHASTAASEFVSMDESGDSESGRFYLFVGQGHLSPSNVFFDVNDEWAARELCGIFTDEFGIPCQYKHVSEHSLRESIRLDEALSELRLYEDPDPGVYDPSPPHEMLMRAQYALRAGDGMSSCCAATRTCARPAIALLARRFQPMTNHKSRLTTSSGYLRNTG